MIGQGLVPPLVLPGAVGAGGADLNQLLAVSARFGLGVDVAVAAGSVQQPVDGAPLPLETVIAPNPGFATFVPAGLDRIPDGNDGVPLPTGALDRDAWAIQTDLKAVMPLYPTEFPVPALWLLEGVDVATVPAVLDQWLGGSVEGVAPETQACHDSAAAGEQGATPEDSYRNRMLAGTWREMLYAAEAALGLASGAGLNPTLTVRAFDENLAEIPVAAVLEATAVVDPVLLGVHPLVLLTAGLAANLPVSIHLRFDVWDVDLATASDSKGAVRPLRPETIRLVADDGGDQLPDLAIQWVDPYAVAELPRSQLEGRSFHAEVDFPPGTTIRLERGQAFTWPFQGDPATWSTAGWTAKSGTATGSWESFSGVQIGSEISPATFWVGTKVRLRLAFEEQVRDHYGAKTSSRVRTRRLAPGHEVALYALRGVDYYDWFTTDSDGEVSGVSFAVPSGRPLGVAIRRHLVDPFGVELKADDEPDALYEQVHGPGSAATRVWLFGDSDFLSEDAREPFHADHFSSGALDRTIRIDADGRNNARGNTAWAAAFHALKFAALTHEAIELLKGGSDDMPERHHFHLVRETGTPFTASYRLDSSRLARSRMPSSRWFTPATVVHEYGHAIVRWLTDTLGDTLRRAAYEGAILTFNQRFTDERRQGKTWHSELLVTNGGLALSEGLAELIEQVLGVGTSLPSGRRRTAPDGQAGWERHLYDIWVPVAGQPASSNFANPFYLSNRSGRNVEGVFAGALWEYLTGPTGLSPLYSSADDTDAGCKQPQEHLDAWLDHRANPADALAQLRRMTNWLLVDPLQTRIGGGIGWTGRWPDDPSGTRYPTVYDFLKRIEDQDPGGVHDPQEQFSWLHDEYLIPWNLEQQVDPPDPALGQDWTP